MAAIEDESFSRRMVIRCTIPELNFEMVSCVDLQHKAVVVCLLSVFIAKRLCDAPQDTYRVGTMLELVRELAVHLADNGNRVRVCVQGSMGEGIFTGLPLSLSGTMAIMTRMDWGDGVRGHHEYDRYTWCFCKHVYS